MSELLRMEHISKRFGDFYANKDISLTVNRGEVLTLLGENGAGKSTLMNILIGLYQPTEGKIFLNGKEVRIESPSQAVKLGIGMVHQHFMLVEAMTVFENIILGDKHAKGLFIDRAARRKEIEELSAKYGLDVQLDKLITEISVGEQQRTEILKALYHGAELLILDEPLSGLDPINADLFKGIIREEIAAGKYLIMSSHQMATVEEFCTDLTILDRSKTVLQGHLNDIKRSYGRVHLQLKTESDPAPYIAECGAQIVTQKEFEYQLKVTGAQQANGLLARLTQAGVPVVLFNLREPSLHEIFVETVGGESDA